MQCQRLWYTVAEGALFLYMRFLFRRPYPKGERMRSDRYNRTGILLLALLILVLLAACDTAEQLITATPKDALLINEVVSSNQLSLQDEIYGSPDWIELVNASAEDLHLSAYYITDNVEAPQKAFQLPDVVLSPGEYYLLYASKKGAENCVGFSLRKSGETLTLLDAHMEEISSLDVPPLVRDVSYARRADGSYGYCDLPTPGASNQGNIQDTLPQSSQLVPEPEPEEVVEEPLRSPDILITELVAKNDTSLLMDGCDECTEWVELYNPNDVSVSLTGFTLTDDAAEVDKHNFPEVELAPGQYLIVCCGRLSCTVPDHVRLDVGLSALGEELYLFDSNGNLLDQVAFPALLTDVSWARKADGSWGYCPEPTPGNAPREADIVNQVSREPQPMDDPFHTVYINEVLYRNERSILDKDGDRSDFVELYNGGESAVSLNGWYLSDNPEKLTKWALPDVFLAPGEYLLVFLSSKDETEGELHASFSLSAGETLTVYNSFDRRYDSLLIPETKQNVSIGRSASGETVFYGHPTPLEANGSPLSTGK